MQKRAFYIDKEKERIMFRKFLTFIMLIFVIIGFGVGLYFGFAPDAVSPSEKSRDKAIFGLAQTKPIEVLEFFTYGQYFNFSGILPGVDKDNFESAKLYLTDGKEFEQTYSLDSSIKDGKLHIFTTNEINSGLELDGLPQGEYVALVRVKTNNSVNAKFYSLSNVSDYRKY